MPRDDDQVGNDLKRKNTVCGFAVGLAFGRRLFLAMSVVTNLNRVSRVLYRERFIQKPFENSVGVGIQRQGERHDATELFDQVSRLPEFRCAFRHTLCPVSDHPLYLDNVAP